jgi:hypothetical protein
MACRRVSQWRLNAGMRYFAVIGILVAALFSPYEATHAKESANIKAFQTKEFIRLTMRAPHAELRQVSLTGRRVTLEFNRGLQGSLMPLFKVAPHEIVAATWNADGTVLTLTLHTQHHVQRVRKFIGEHSFGIDLVLVEASASKKTIPEKVVLEKVTPKEISSEKAMRVADQPAAIAATPPAVLAPENMIPVLPVIATNVEQGINWMFIWPQATAAAMFARKSGIWIVFDRFAPIDIDALKRQSPFPMNITQMDHAQATILVIDSPHTPYFSIDRAGNNWRATLATGPMRRARGSTLIKGLLQRVPPRWVELSEMPSMVIRVEDPAIGDELAIAPILSPDYLVVEPKRMIDFSILATKQGIAAVLYADDIHIDKVPEGLSFSLPSRMLDSEPDNAEAHDSNSTSSTAVADSETYVPAQALPQESSFFDFHWLQDATEHGFKKVEKALRARIIQAPPAQRSLLRLDLAQFYFSHALYAEALGVLDTIAVVDAPFSASHPMVAMLRGASLYMMKHYSDAKENLGTIDTVGLGRERRAEVDFWQRAIQQQIYGFAEKKLNFLAYTNRFLRAYPTKLLMHLGTMELESCIQLGDARTAERVLAFLEPYANKNDMKTLNYYRGRIALLRDDSKQAIALWTPLAEDVLDRYHRVHARFELIKLGRQQKTLPLEDAINQVELLQLIWRGDDLEMTLLEYLGDLYIEDARPVEALYVWRDAIISPASKAGSLSLVGRITRLYEELQMNTDPNAISDLKAVAIYFEFRELMPVGQRGDAIIEMLTQRLIRLDLLTRAISLLEHLVKYREQGLNREKRIIELARIYLLNRQPEKALEALVAPVRLMLPRELALERGIVQAAALIDTEQYAKALSVLGDIPYKEYRALKRQIFWQTQRWNDLVRVTEPEVAAILELGQPITQQEAVVILQLAVAYSLDNKQEALRRLLTLATPALGNYPMVTQTFEFLTKSYRPINFHDLAGSLGTIQMENYVDTLRAMIRKRPNLSPDTNAPAPPPVPEPVAIPAPGS